MKIRTKIITKKHVFFCVPSVDAVGAEGNKPPGPVPLSFRVERAHLFILCVTYPTMVLILDGHSKNVAPMWNYYVSNTQSGLTDYLQNRYTVQMNSYKYVSHIQPSPIY